MTCSAKYLEDTVYYEPWKTKYIESFCALHAKMRIAFLQRTYQEDCENFVYLFLNSFYGFQSVWLFTRITFCY